MTAESRPAVTALTEQFGEGEASIRSVSAPGRVNLIGGHTDYNEGFVLPTAIDRRTTVATRGRNDDRLRVYSVDFDETVTADLDSIEPVDDPRWANYVLGVAAELRERGHDVGGADLVVDGGVPMGAGLSSSSALEVAVADGLATVSDIEMERSELVTVCWTAENEFVGVGCGIMDQYTAVFSERGSALFLDCRTRDHEVIPFGADDVALIATDTNVQHELVDSAYNERVQQCQTGVDHFQQWIDGDVTSLRDVSPDAFEQHASSLPETVRKRVRHVVSENERVQEAAAALRRADFERVGELLVESHESLRDDYEVSSVELDAVVDVASRQSGVLGSRMTGAGFGGCVVSLVRPSAIDEVATAIRDGYRERTNIDPDICVCRPDGGLTRHDGAPSRNE